MKRVLKLVVVVVLVAQWYSRGGREFLFGTDLTEEISGVLDTFKAWIDLPPGVRVSNGEMSVEVLNREGETVGRVIEGRWKEDARDPAGFPTEQMQVRAEFLRAMLGYPINVALAQAESLTHRSLGIG